MLRLQVITASTRDGRAGPKVAEWFHDRCRRHGRFEIEPIDLREVNLPLFDEPRHPRLRQYQHEHTKRWSASVDRADAYVFVTPEYNYGTPPALLNALDYLVWEWAYKPAGFVSYGGVSAGTRGVQMTKLVATSLRMMTIPEAVSVPFFEQLIDRETGRFTPSEKQEQAAVAMLDELLRWAEALQAMRPPRS